MPVLSSRVFVSKAASYCTGPGTNKSVINTRLKIGDVSVDLKTPKRLEFVPRGYASINAPQSTLNHLKWLLQKDGLKQDVFLIGIPGTTRINLVLQYLELANREYEYLPITRDTTEADIKQRREIRSGTAYYVDLCAIRAAIEGRVLVIDGVEKAERNVLPILNNLLENREVQLDDGRFLVAPEKYDKLLKDHSLDELKAWKLERVSTDFQVIALGLPVPKFRGHTLDPPLRSRFQSRNVQTLPYEECFRLLKSIAPNITPDRLTSLISTAYAMNVEESGSVGLPQFPIDNLSIGAAIWNLNPEFTTDYIMRLLYPHRSMLKKEAQDQVHNYYNKFNVNTSTDKTKLTNSIAILPSVDQHDNSSIMTDVHCTWADKDHKLKLTVLCGTNQSDSNNNNSVYVSTNSHNRLLTEMCLSHAIGDFCLIGGKGCGKTTLVHKFANMLNYDVTTVMLYQDMSSRELLQQRRMLPNGDTIWEDSVLVNAAKRGHLCILDGLHRIHHSALNVLQRLVHHRELHLFDGTRLLSKSRYDHVKAVAQLNNTQLADRKIFAIDERFRLVGIAEPPNVHDSSQHWLTPELLTLFVHHEIAPLSADEEATVISARIPDVSSQVERTLLEFVATMRQSPDTNFRSIADSLSTRQLLRIMRRLTAHSDESLRFLIKKACLSRFLPHLTKSSLDDALDRSKIIAPLEKLTTSTTSPLKCETRDGIVQIGNTFAKSFAPLNRTMVPDILFYDNEQHIRVMEDMLRDFQLGEHLLLIGNQGVGKNKVADRFLQLLNRPRQYIQLHRDTTVQTLTLQANVIDGILVYEDSPLVKAVKHGDILVVDEGDKAPTHVTCILKSLLESQQMHLADGRRIVPTDYVGNIDPANTIRMHRDFRMIVLANRPGFPFLGNDFFGALGDLFACHTIDNPGRDSELQMLRKYGPNVPVETLDKLVSAFDELRLLADQGLLNYPYSTRELVNIIRHLNRYPTDGLPSVVSNVFDFDAFSADSMESVVTVLRRNGIPIGIRNSVEQIKLAASFPMPPMKQIGQWHISANSSPTRVASHTVSLTDTIKKPFRYTLSRFAVDRTDMRVSSFTEQAISWQLPVQDVTICSDVVYCDGHICVAAINPLCIFILDNLNDSMASSIDFTEMFPSTRGQFRPRLRLAPLSERRVLVHEEMTNTLLLLNINDQTCTSIDIASENLMNTLLSKRTVDSSTNHWRMSGSQQAQQSQRVYLYRRNSNLIKMVDFDNGQISEMTLPNDVHIIHCCPIDTNQLLVNTTNGYKLLDKQQSSSHQLYSVECSGDIPHIDKSVSLSNDASATMLTEIETKSSSSSRLFSSEQYHALVGDLSNLVTADKCAIYGIRRIENEDSVDSRKPYWVSSDIWRQFSNPETNSVLLTDPIQCIRVLPNWRTPSKVMTKDINLNHTAAFLEISDLSSRQASYIPVPTAKYQCSNPSWLSSLMESTVLLTAAPTKGIVTCDNSGGIRLWQTDQTMLKSSISAWKKMFGTDDERLRIEYDRNENEADMSKLDDPKIGKFDPSNAPHMGGNTWAGGTGGYSTAGLGGIGGPFRLDAGNDVAQMPDSVKEQVPEHIRQKARQVAREEYQKRLREIDMSEHDADAYNQLYTKIAKQSAQLKVVIENLQAKSKERQWMRHQTSGDLDEGKLIEGLVGDKTIYRRRVEKQPEPGTPIMKPKRMRICVDVSGSMYRFNGYDGRLQRTLESCLMVMDSLDHHADKMKYDIVGHSGDQPDFPFVNADRPPSNEKERLDVLKKMLLHAQFCVSGDNTLEATKDAIDTLIAEGDDTVDERFVIVLSDANLDRYGIRARDIATLMERDERVHVFVVLIGSLGEQANRLRSALPVGKAFVCQNTGDLPHIMQTIFASTLFDTTPSG